MFLFSLFFFSFGVWREGKLNYLLVNNVVYINPLFGREEEEKGHKQKKIDVSLTILSSILIQIFIFSFFFSTLPNRFLFLFGRVEEKYQLRIEEKYQRN